MNKRNIVVCALALSVLTACVSPNEMAMKVGAPPEGVSTVDLRAIQTRRYDTLDERRMLLAASQTMQDLGFTITESSAEAGVLVGSKQRDAEEGAQIAGQLILTLLMAATGTVYIPTWDKDQTININLVLSPIKNSKQTSVRVSFDRRINNNQGQLWKTELIKDPEIHQQFFEKLSKSVFLEEHRL